MKNFLGKAAIMAACGSAALVVSSPAAAAIYTYNQTNGDVLTIDSTTKSGSLKGSKIDVTFTGSDFGNFIGTANPTGAYKLDSLDGTRTVSGQQYTDNPSHQQIIKFLSKDRVNLWSWWGNPIVAGDYVTKIASYTPPTTGGTPVPAPGIFGLLGLALAGLGFARRRKAAPAQNKLAFA
ncbi:MAG: LPXTG cell wall anchor domain-containing protein [Sphingorhabdus sp.]